MPVVSNTSPVLNLAIIGQLSLLHEQLGEVWIPTAVLEELRVEEDMPGCARGIGGRMVEGQKGKRPDAASSPSTRFG